MIGNHTLKLALRGIPFNSLFPPRLLELQMRGWRKHPYPILIILILIITIIVIIVVIVIIPILLILLLPSSSFLTIFSKCKGGESNHIKLIVHIFGWKI